ncbi:MAG TPA: endonuclease [Bacteroidia bacterium]|jgi:hypothetical protein
MKKIIYAFLLVLTANINAIAQAVLPTTWSFTTTGLPTGWTESGTSFYTSSGATPPACKFDNTGDMVTIYFASNPGNLTYYLAGNSFAGGTFLVEESANGTSWTTLHTFTSPPSATYTLFTDVPNTATRYIRFNYSVKVTGNIGLDDVTINAGVAGPAQEINVKQGASTIVTGGTFNTSSPVSTMTPTTFTIENLGTTNTLNISSVNITGPASADLAVSSAPTTVSALSNGNLVINFTPSVAGTRNAVITINSDDADEAAYVINFNGIGGSYATEPTAQASSLVFTNIKSYRFNAAFTPATGSPDGYIVLRRNGAAITDIPADGTIYQRGDVIGNSMVVCSGSITSFSPHNIVASTDYYFSVFTYNGTGAYRNYYTTSPLTGMVTSAGSMQPASYYSSVSTSNSTFVTDLHNKINPHTQQFYSNYGPKMVMLFASRDTTDDQRVITCVYSGQNKIYAEPFDWTANGFSREHTYCHNWMPTNPATGLPEYDDYHHLFPTNQNDANAVRSNYPLGEVVTASYTYLGCKLGTDVNGKIVFEPRDEQKGDAARALMYEATCYNGVSGNNWAFPNPISGTIPYGQDQNVLKRWHYQDPPSSYEIARNDFVDSLQNNRNPFVDSMQYACYIDFSTMTKITGPMAICITAGISENHDNADLLMVAPNPNTGNFTAYYTSSKEQKVEIKLFDMIGKVVYSQSLKVNTGNNPVEINTIGLDKGIYLFELSTLTGKQAVKLVIN